MLIMSHMNERTSKTKQAKAEQASLTQAEITNSPTARKAHRRNNISTAVGKRLKAIRLEKRISQENLAFSAQFDRAFISDIERGVANPSVLAIATLCYALDITLADLFGTIHLALKPGDTSRRANPSKVAVTAEAVKKSRPKRVPVIR